MNTPSRASQTPLASLALLFFALPICAVEPVEFNRDIRPILNAHCIKCHGGVKETGGLNLQFREQALKEGESGEVAIVPGKPEESAVIARLTSTDKTERMPKKADPLRPEQIELIKRWVAEGANWQEHWAYVPPRRSAKASIDAIVEARLAGEGLSLSPEADRWTLARSTALDVTGLPTTLEDATAFVNDTMPDAYERWVDRLLGSSAYGERWAVPWLDLARYADSKGYESDRFRDMWRYRDWLIDALNRDLPYDRFVVEQLAGDLLPGAGNEQIIATAFHRNTPQNDEGGTDDEEFRTYAVIDRLNTTFDALQGTSIGCVQCHGHPYDPFVHREYYGLLAFFNNTADADRNDQAPTRTFRARADEEKAAALEREIKDAQGQLDSSLKAETARAAFSKWLTEIRPNRAMLELTEPQIQASAGKYIVRPSGRIRLEGPAPDRTTLAVSAKTASGQLSAIELQMVPDETLPGRGPGASPGPGNFVLTRVRAALLQDGKEIPLPIERATATFEQAGWPIAEALREGAGPKGEGEGGWAIAGGTGKTQIATFHLKDPITVQAGAELRVTLECENERWSQHVLGSFKIGALSSTVTAEQFASMPVELQKLLERNPDQWKPEERGKVERHFFSVQDPALAQLYRALDERRAALAAMPVCDLPIMQELTGKEVRTTKTFHRGNWMDKREPVQPHTPQILNGWRDEYPPNRLGFAMWLTSMENPLTARVQVNRVWEQLFGVGLVETLEDFGSQGDKPIHQELLDDLAARFQTSMKWSQKTLLREILLSRVYRQSSKATKALLERDPANRLLARGARFRLSSEQIRDQALAVGGILSAKMYGPPVMPYQPAGTWLVPYEGRDWVTAQGDDAHRRALYTFIRRSATYPSMITFDAPNREYCVVRRTRTNTPLQSLDLLNSPVFMEAAAGLAQRMTREGGADLDAQLSRGLFLAAQRPPRPEQVAVLTKLHARVDGNMTLVANAILNSDEVLNRN